MATAKTEKQYLFELSLEHPEFPYTELSSVCERLGDVAERLSDWLSVVRTERDPGEMMEYAGCLAFTVRFSLLQGRYNSWESLREGVFALAEKEKGVSAAVRIASKAKSMKARRLGAERELGSIVAEKCPIDLENPDNEFRVIESEGSYFLGSLIASVDRKRIDSRQAKNRTYFSPVSLSPRYARAFLNICGVSTGKLVLDPFCGTGGILIEAALLGATIAGSDIDPEMVAGTRANLQQAIPGREWDLHTIDVGQIRKLGMFDAVVTDPPYGRSSFKNSEELSALYSRALRSILDVLVVGGMIGIVVPDASLLPELPGLEKTMQLQNRVHGSLVRNYIVMKKRETTA